MTKDIKVLAFKKDLPRRSSKSNAVEGISQDTKPGNNTPDEVRDAQRNLLACAIAAGVVGVISYDDGLGVVHRLDNENYDPVMEDVLEMITPNTAYVTGTPSMGQIKESFGDSGLSRKQRDDYWKGQRGGNET